MSTHLTQDPTNLVGRKLASPVWGNVSYEVTQDFGVVGFRPDWYDYSRYHGFPPGYHIGLDVATPKGTPVFANAEAMVKQAGFSESFRPNPVILETVDDPRTSTNEAGITEIYGHLWSNKVTTGQSVKKGDLLGYTGEQTQRGTMVPDGSGPHIHFEVYDKGGKAVNPLPMLEVGFIPNPSVPKPGTDDPYQYDNPARSTLDCVLNPAACLNEEIAGLKSALSTVASRGLVALAGFVLLAIGLFAVASGGLGKATSAVPVARVAKFARKAKR